MKKHANGRRRPATADAGVTVRISEELRYRANVVAAKERKLLREVLEEVLDEGLKKRGA